MKIVEKGPGLIYIRDGAPSGKSEFRKSNIYIYIYIYIYTESFRILQKYILQKSLLTMYQQPDLFVPWCH
ncbi:MAG: hypothetical protein J8272_00970, partial ['Prunus persica' phytoplasma PP2]|nr:hypothetical protein ['Prunus persica' phytoplasma PP2]